MSLRILVACAGIVCALSGCVGGLIGKVFTRREAAPVQVSAPGRLIEPVIGPPAVAQGCAKRNERLTLDRAFWLSHIYNPELAVYSYETRVRDAKVLQAGLEPNPELGVEVENFGGTGYASGSESTETTVTLSHLIPPADLS
jgi:outer membrane protein, heavy metal efflux system